MGLEERLKNYRDATQTEPGDEKIRETVARCKNTFFMAEKEKMLPYHEFLWMQLRAMQKRWWLLQFLLLTMLWLILSSVQEELYITRSMGVAAPLFVILIIPELWKNRTYGCMEIEAVTYYSLRQVYAARMLLFGITDVFLLTIFCWTASVGLHYDLSHLLVQFLFPLAVTACICFGILCSRRCLSETTAIFLCIIWSAGWLFIVLNNEVYARIAIPVWGALLCGMILFLVFAVCRVIHMSNQYLEVFSDET